MCVTPPIYNMGKVSVSISLNGKDFIRTPIVFTFTAAPNISSINPTMIKEMEESIITVHGRNFIDVNTIVCRFGTKIAKGIWLSNSEIQCRSPKMSPGNTKFDISLNSKDYTSAHFSINVIENFHISSVLPSRGSIHGGTKIFLRGNGFTNTGNLYCVFNLPTNDIRVGAFFVSSKEVSCVTPSIKMTDASSLVAISISLDKLVSNKVNFVYENHLIVDEILPVAGTTAGGTDVRIFGQGFPESNFLMCSFGNGTFVEAQYVNSNEIVCTSPVT